MDIILNNWWCGYKKKDIKNKKILMVPYSDFTIKLKKQLQKEVSFEFVGYVDRDKTADSVYSYDELKKLNFDLILICSRNYADEIYDNLKGYKRYKVHYYKQKFCFINMFKVRIERAFVDIAQKFPKFKNKVVFISENGFEPNLKYSFLEIRKSKKAVILFDDKKIVKKIKNTVFKPSFLYSLRGYYHLISSKTVIVAHSNAFNPFYPYINFSTQKTIQMWHGVGLKKMSISYKDYPYDYFISTSNWTNETNFKNVFIKTKNFLNYGYPRNDVLLKEKLSKEDYIFCDKKLMEIAKNNTTIIYMPTFRNDNKFPLNLEKLNNFLVKNNFFMIIKLHYFVFSGFGKLDDFNIQQYSNIKFTTTNTDIYPVLKFTDMLITDYSSIAYDYMLLDKPIIFYIYDYDEYIKKQPMLFDFYDYTPGVKVKTQEELFFQISNQFINPDRYKDKRKDMIKLFYDYVDDKSSKRICELIK
jgi:CDP-glycerol glycerophosphotransferase (TagB/SpsB family)